MTPEDLTGPPQVLAPRLLGCLLVARSAVGTVAARLVEVEAYGGPGEDPGSHAHRGRRRRNATMFGRPGLLYVYFTYGMHWCANVVCHVGGAESAGAVLLRAARVEQGRDIAAARRRRPGPERDLARGPARLARALGLDGSHDGVDLLARDSPVRLVAGPRPSAVRAGPRVGVAGDGAATPWRHWDPTAREVSAYRRAVPRRRPAVPRAARDAGATPATGVRAGRRDRRDASHRDGARGAPPST